MTTGKTRHTLRFNKFFVGFRPPDGIVRKPVQLLIWILAKLNCPFEIKLEKNFEFYETKTDNLNIYPNGIISFDSTLQEFYNSLQNNDDGDTFATIVVPYYKGKN